MDEDGLARVYGRASGNEAVKVYVAKATDESSDEPFGYHEVEGKAAVGVVVYTDGEGGDFNDGEWLLLEDNSTGACDVLFEDGSLLEAIAPERIVSASAHHFSEREPLQASEWHAERARKIHARGAFALAACEFLEAAACAASASAATSESASVRKCAFQAGDAVEVHISGDAWRDGVVGYVDEDDCIADVLFSSSDCAADNIEEEEGVQFRRLRHRATHTTTAISTAAIMRARFLVNASHCHLLCSRPLPAQALAAEAISVLSRGAGSMDATHMLARAHYVRALASARTGAFRDAREAIELCSMMGTNSTDVSRLRNLVKTYAKERKLSDARIAKAVTKLLENVSL